MALVLADRVKVTTTTTGTGAVALGAAQAGYQNFSVLSNGDTTYYCIVDNATGDWEVGLGTYASAGPSLARTSVIASSTGTAVSFGAGPKDVFITLPAERVVTTDGADFSGPVTVPAGATGSQVPRSSEVVHMTGAETIAGVKTFSSKPVVPAGATGAEVPQAQEIFGKSQSWQTVTRTSGVTYTNSTGKPIIVMAFGESNNAENGLSGTVNGDIAVWSSWEESGVDLNISFVVPPGSTYKVTVAGVATFTVKEYR